MSSMRDAFSVIFVRAFTTRSDMDCATRAFVRMMPSKGLRRERLFEKDFCFEEPLPPALKEPSARASRALLPRMRACTTVAASASRLVLRLAK